MEKILSFISNHYEVAIMAVIMVFQYVRAVKAGKTGKQALLIAINTLKDEKKMEDSGDVKNVIFKPETIIKAKHVANEMDAGIAAFEQVEDLLIKANNKKGLKIGSHKGKPIYLEDAIGIFGMLKTIFK